MGRVDVWDVVFWFLGLASAWWWHFYQRKHPTRTEDKEMSASDPGAKTFSWLPGPPGTYVFGADDLAGVAAAAGALDVALSKAVDAYVPTSVVDGAGEAMPAPYVATQAEDVARDALARVAAKTDYHLSLVSVEHVAVAADAKENLRYDMTLMAYDVRRNVASKIVVVALVTPTGKTYVKRCVTFGRLAAINADPAAPRGTDDFAPRLAPYRQQLGIDYEALYPA